MRITRRHHAALSIAAVLAAGSLTLTACGNGADPRPPVPVHPPP